MLYDDLYEVQEDIKEQLINALESKSVIARKEATCVIDIFSKTNGHISSDEFSKILKKNGLIVNNEKASIILNIFAELGFAFEQQFDGDDFLRYERLNPSEHHDHFICIKCKKIIEFGDSNLERLQDTLITDQGCKPLFHKLQVYGICDECLPNPKTSFPIIYAKENTNVELDKIESGWSLRKRLTELGFTSNAKIYVVKNSNFGPVVLEVKGTRFAIGRGEAQKIFVF